ncbi:MAG: FecR family protein [Bacteroidota bacterium]
MPHLYSIEELVINDSFINYCFRTNQEDTAWWNNYLESYPGEKEKAEEACNIIIALKIMLKDDGLHQGNPSNLLQSIKEEETDTPSGKVIKLGNRNRYRKISILIASVAAALILILAASYFFTTKIKNSPKPEILSAHHEKKPALFSVGLGEKKLIILPDSTKVYLNAGSVLTLADDFGKENRIVNLKGEAMFEVTHNKALPFLVHTDKYYVRVLGTVFNVKAYPGDKTSETSLVSGKVEIFMQKDSSDYLYKVLQPHQKFVMSVNENANAKTEEPLIRTAIAPLSYNRDEEIIETAWIHNRLIIENEKFADIKEKIERRYDVMLDFQDDDVKQYSFTAAFESENIDQVMRALKASYNFTYKIEGRNIKISKRNTDSK